MTLQLKTSLNLHCSVGLMDWDMDKEMKLATITDDFCHDDKLNDHYVVQRPSARASRRKDDFIWYDETSDTFVKPNLWLLVDPNIVCPIQYRVTRADVEREHAEGTPYLDPAEMQHPHTAEFPMFSPLEEQQHVSSSSKYMNEDPSRRPAKNRRQGRSSKAMDIVKPGCWPRPPVNYSILIALALKSSHSGSLKVQQIYSFTREHFPFFQTAPDGWKNTIRHNLCFNSSFRKTCNQLYRDGKRKSCFWHLTPDGHRRLKDELHMLTGETLRQLERSMSLPDIIWSLLET